MDAERPGDALSESAVDRELQAMLGVEPSPDFLARVHTRIASEPEPTAWWLSWTFAVGVAIAAVVVFAVVMARPREAVRHQPVERREASTDVARPTPSAAVTAQEPYVAQGPYVASAFRRTGSATSRAKAGRHVRAGDLRAQGPAENEVLIDARESAALRALILGTRDGRVDLEPVLRASTPAPMDLPPVDAIDIPFLTIDPIAPGTGEEGVPQ
jgi:hypothetical protein